MYMSDRLNEIFELLMTLVQGDFKVKKNFFITLLSVRLYFPLAHKKDIITKNRNPTGKDAEESSPWLHHTLHLSISLPCTTGGGVLVFFFVGNILLPAAGWHVNMDAQAQPSNASIRFVHKETCTLCVCLLRLLESNADSRTVTVECWS